MVVESVLLNGWLLFFCSFCVLCEKRRRPEDSLFSKSNNVQPQRDTLFFQNFSLRLLVVEI